MRERKVEKGKNPLKENVIDNTWGYYCPTSICLVFLNLLMGTSTPKTLWEKH